MKSVSEIGRIFYYRVSDLLSEESERQALWLPVAFACGIGVYFSLPFEPPFFLTLCASALVLFLSFDCRRSPKPFRASLFLTAFALGFAAAQFRTLDVSAPSLKTASRTVTVTGKVLSAEPNAYGKIRVILEKPTISGFEDWATPKKLRLTLKKGDTQPKTGETIRFDALLFPPSPPLISNGYDQAFALYFEGIGGTGFARTTHEKIAEAPHDKTFEGLISKTREAVNKALSENLPPDIAEVAKALTTGTTKGIPENIAQAYRDSGIAHLLSVSGLHMSLIAGGVFGVIRLFLACFPAFALRYSTKKAASAAALAAAFVYLFISGNAVPARRSFIMIAFAFTAVFFDRRALSLVAAAWAAFFILLFRPESLLSVSFQLSFAAVIALVAAYEAGIDGFRRRLAAKEGLPFFLLSCLIALVATDIIAGTATAPFALYYFGRYPLYSLLGNLASSAVTGFIVMPFLAAGTLLIPFGLECLPYRIAGYGIAFINFAAEKVADLPAAVIRTPAMPFWGLMCCVFGGLWMCLWKTKIRYKGGILFVLGLLSPVFYKSPDLLISPGASIIAFKTADGQLILPTGKADALARRVWLEKNGQAAENAEGCFECFKGRGYNDPTLAFGCEKGLCLLRKGGKTIAWTKGKRAFKRACSENGKEISIMFAGIPRFRAECPHFPVVNRTDSLKSGTNAVLIENGNLNVRSIAEETGFRPWTAAYPALNLKREAFPFVRGTPYGFPVKARMEN